MYRYRQLAKKHSEKWKLLLNYGYEAVKNFDIDEWYEALAALEVAEKEAKNGSGN